MSAAVLGPLRDAIQLARARVRVAQGVDQGASPHGLDEDAAGRRRRLSTNSFDPQMLTSNVVSGTYLASLRSHRQPQREDIDAAHDRLLLEDAARHFRRGRLPDAWEQLALGARHAHDRWTLAQVLAQRAAAALLGTVGALSRALFAHWAVVTAGRVRRLTPYQLHRVAGVVHAWDLYARGVRHGRLAARRWKGAGSLRGLASWESFTAERLAAVDLLRRAVSSLRHRSLARALRTLDARTEQQSAARDVGERAVRAWVQQARLRTWRALLHATRPGRLLGGALGEARRSRMSVLRRAWASLRRIASTLGAVDALTTSGLRMGRAGRLRWGQRRLVEGARLRRSWSLVAMGGRTSGRSRALSRGLRVLLGHDPAPLDAAVERVDVAINYHTARLLAVSQHRWRGRVLAWEHRQRRVARAAGRRQRAWRAWVESVGLTRAAVARGAMFASLRPRAMAMRRLASWCARAGGPVAWRRLSRTALFAGAGPWHGRPSKPASPRATRPSTYSTCPCAGAAGSRVWTPPGRLLPAAWMR